MKDILQLKQVKDRKALEECKMLKHINKNEFELEVLKDEKIVVVDFFAQWCGPCKMLSPVLEEVQEEMKNIKIVKVDIDENPETAAEHGVTNIPTVKIFKNGKEITTRVGFLPKQQLIDMISKTL